MVNLTLLGGFSSQFSFLFASGKKSKKPAAIVKLADPSLWLTDQTCNTENLCHEVHEVRLTVKLQVSFQWSLF